MKNDYLKIFKIKTKTGSIERVHDPHTLIGKDLFKKETDMNLFVGMKVKKDNGM
jgi:selenocysteine-specific elongation factor